jgi:hypothetical protein
MPDTWTSTVLAEAIEQVFDKAVADLTGRYLETLLDPVFLKAEIAKGLDPSYPAARWNERSFNLVGIRGMDTLLLVQGDPSNCELLLGCSGTKRPRRRFNSLL